MTLGCPEQQKASPTKLPADLQTSGYTVTLAGIKSSAAAHTANYRVIVVGGPIYAGTPTGSVKDFLSNLNPAKESKSACSEADKEQPHQTTCRR